MKLSSWHETRKDGKLIWNKIYKYQVIIYTKDPLYRKYIGFASWPDFNFQILNNRLNISKVELINKYTDKIEIQFRPKYQFNRINK